MMIVKICARDATWEMWEAADEIRFLGPHSVIEVPTQHHDQAGEFCYGEDDRFPYADHYHVIELFDTDAEGRPVPERFVRWVSWRDVRDQQHTLITDGPVYICNSRGDTVENLPAGGAGAALRKREAGRAAPL